MVGLYHNMKFLSGGSHPPRIVDRLQIPVEIVPSDSFSLNSNVPSRPLLTSC